MEIAASDSQTRRIHRDWPGTLTGIVVFLGGIGLLIVTFSLAWRMFSVRPEDAFDLQPNKPLDIGVAGQKFMWQIVQVLLLLVMAAIGSVIANRGIRLYGDALRVIGKRKP